MQPSALNLCGSLRFRLRKRILSEICSLLVYKPGANQCSLRLWICKNYAAPCGSGLKNVFYEKSVDCFKPEPKNGAFCSGFTKIMRLLAVPAFFLILSKICSLFKTGPKEWSLLLWILKKLYGSLPLLRIRIRSVWSLLLWI
jgi:hypothetical protein